MEPLREYREALKRERASGQATEHSYRPAVKALLEALGGDGVRAINEPTHEAYGAPDFIVERNGVPVGHIECKNIGADLEAEAESEQLRRYRDALPNLILTDQCQFRWYVNGELREHERLGRFDREGQFVGQRGGERIVRVLLESFFAASTPATDDPADLARRMAGKTRLLRHAIERILDAEADSGSDMLRDLLRSYRQVLFSRLDADQFADMQAQTIAYGLFAARCVRKEGADGFTREAAVFAQTAPFLRDVFGRIAGPSADARIAWIVDDFARLLARADMSAILDGFGQRSRRQDPVVHFYEDFLAAYDPGQKERRGVFYTPEPVVSYIVRSIDQLLRREFGIADGLADAGERVLILDPAAGTGTFLRETVATIRETVARKGRGGAWPQYVRQHLLPRLFGFELLMAPYAICHLRLAFELGGEAREFQMPLGERLNVFLTNTLEEAHEAALGPAFAGEIAKEAREAEAVKREKPVMVVLGNPPYSGHSANKGAWIDALMHGRVEGSPESYFTVDGGPLDERNTKWVNDDYVKFIRFAQWRIEQTGEGVLGFITNHGYLDNPTYCGMRQSLMATFDEIRLLDLHGNAKKKERAPGGGPDQNVFDIQQGVAIGLFVKRRGGSGQARVFHYDLWGPREVGADGGKYRWLARQDVESTDWTELTPRTPDYLFIPRDEALMDEYRAGWRLTDILPVNSVGIVTGRDRLVIQWTADDMRRVAEEFITLGVEEAREAHRLDKDSSDWRVADAQQDIRDHQNESPIIPILYRPFDERATYYTGKSGGIMVRPRPQIMPHLLAGPNLGLCVGRAGQVIGSNSWEVVFPTKFPTDLNLFRRGGNCLFPLYLYSTQAIGSGQGRTPNLAPEFTQAVAEATGLAFTPDGAGDLAATFGPEDVFHWCYAVLHSPEYRRRYADFLKSDFPRVPLPANRALFAEMAALGARLSALHLMEAEGRAEDEPAFDVGGGNRVDRVRYTEPVAGAGGRVLINKTQYFEGVAPETWAFTIGGYRPAEKWLKDRKGRTLAYDDIARYQRICAALAETPRLMARIDGVIDAHGGWPIG